LWGTPAIKALRQSLPDCYLAVLTSPIGKEIFKHNRQIDELFVLKKPIILSLFFLLFTLRKREIGTVLVFHTSQRAVLPFCALLGAWRIIGTEEMSKGLDSLLTVAVDKKPIHEIERRLEIVSKVGAHTLDPTLEFHVTESEEERCENFLKRLKIPPYLPLIGLHPGAKDAFKKWPPEKFIALGNRLVDHFGCQILVTGNREEKPLAEQIAKGTKGAISVAGDLLLGEMGALIKRMSLMVSNDTGPMHVAFALKTPTVALFAPTDPALCGPYFSSAARIIAKRRTCSPCLRKKCQDPFCMLQISEEEVYDAAIELFYKSKAVEKR
jgi:lipopolysaccharide heptosyltransferase II